MRAMTPSGTVPSTIAGRIRCRSASTNGALLIRQRGVDHHEAGRLVEVVFDEVDAARDRRPAEIAPRRT